jgi:hypothetical protein
MQIRSFRNLDGSQGIRLIREAACAGPRVSGRRARRRDEAGASCWYNGSRRADRSQDTKRFETILGITTPCEK